MFAEASNFTEGNFCSHIYLELERISSDFPLLTAVETYQRWYPRLARYSFHTRLTVSH